MTHRVELTDPATGETRTLDELDLERVEFGREHTAMSSFSLATGYDSSLEDYALGDVVIRFDGEVLFRGTLETVESNERRVSTTLEGRGVERELTNDSAAVTYSDIDAWQAIRDYWDTHVDTFDATVHEPPAARETDGEKQAAETESEFETLLDAAPTDPLVFEGGGVRLADSSTLLEGQAFPTGTVVSDGAASGGEALRVNDRNDEAFLGAEFAYDLPSETVAVAARVKAPSGTTPGVEFRFEGETAISLTAGDPLDDTYVWLVETVDLAENVPAGEHNVALDVVTETGDDLDVDVVVPLDDRFEYTYPDSVNDDGFLDGPEAAPHAFDVVFPAVELDARVVEITAEATLDDTSNEQLIGVSLDAENWVDEPNATLVTGSFPSSLRTTAFGRIRLSRYGTSSTSSPATGTTGQTATEWSLATVSENPARIDEQRLEGDHLQNLQRLHELAGMRFSVDHASAEPFDAESFAPGDVARSAAWRLEDKTRRLDVSGYANVVTVRGAKDSNGERLTATAENAAGVDRFGEQVVVVTDPNLETKTEVENRAVTELLGRLDELDLSGSLDIVPKAIDPGYSYPVAWGDDGAVETPLERVEYSDSTGGLRGSLEFDPRDALELELVALRGETRRVTSAV